MTSLAMRPASAKHRIDIVHGQVAEEALLERGGERRTVFERIAHVGEGGVIGHG